MSAAHKTDEAAGERAGKERTRRIAIGILAAVALLFAVLNFDSVKVNLLFATVTMPLVIVIAACLLIGGLIGAYVGRRSRRSR
ncbi:MAG: lipopolysaccharide assembly protein LapA domain-containing protein [Conexibacter sp.]